MFVSDNKTKAKSTSEKFIYNTLVIDSDTNRSLKNPTIRQDQMVVCIVIFEVLRIIALKFLQLSPVECQTTAKMRKIKKRYLETIKRDKQ